MDDKIVSLCMPRKTTENRAALTFLLHDWLCQVRLKRGGGRQEIPDGITCIDTITLTKCWLLPPNVTVRITYAGSKRENGFCELCGGREGPVPCSSGLLISIRPRCP
jgi:hypothetical protein